MKALELTGQKFGQLSVLGQDGKTSGGNLMWLCRCDCGSELRVAGGNLRHSTHPTKSCGCIHKTQKGQSSLPEFKVWAGMISRCHIPTDISYKNYGARGVIVCERWRTSFDAFYEDVGPRPAGTNGKRASYTIDRIDTHGDYEPGNVRWSTWKEQQNNRRTNRKVTHDGETHSLAEWARKVGLSRQALRYRLENGWTVEEALTRRAHMGAPPRSRKRDGD